MAAIEGIPFKVFREYEEVRLTGRTNMFDVTNVISIAQRLELNKLVDFVLDEDEMIDKSLYAKILKNYVKWRAMTQPVPKK